MKKNFYLISATVMILSYCLTTTSGNNQPDQECSKPDPAKNAQVNKDNKTTDLSHLFTLSDAEKILEDPAHLTYNSSKRGGNLLTYQCAYEANVENQESRKTGAVYLLAEQYKKALSAHEKYTFIKTANEKHEGVKTLDNLGDEAYFHSDGKNFYFIMVRKGRKVFNMKVNKITGTTSFDEFNLVAKKITMAL